MFFFQSVYEGLCNEILLGPCSENDEDRCGFGLPLEAALTIAKTVQSSVVYSLCTCLFKGSANCATFAAAQRLYLVKRNLFWGYLVSRGELCKLVHRYVSRLGMKPGYGFAFSLLLQALHPYGSKDQAFIAHTNNGCHLVFLIPPTCKEFFCKNGSVAAHRLWTLPRCYCLCSDLVCPICQVASFRRGVSILRDS